MDDGFDDPFCYETRKSGDVVISRQGRIVTTLRGDAAAKFLRKVVRGDAQQVMARVTGNYRRGNERTATTHPRNDDPAGG